MKTPGLKIQNRSSLYIHCQLVQLASNLIILVCVTQVGVYVCERERVRERTFQSPPLRKKF